MDKENIKVEASFSTFTYTEEDVKILADALKEAFIAVGCDLNYFDWFNYRRDLTSF